MYCVRVFVFKQILYYVFIMSQIFIITSLILVWIFLINLDLNNNSFQHVA